MNGKYQILRVLNNNIILATNVSKNTEVVLMGNGIGFGKKVGQITTLDDKVIEKAFVTGDKNLKQSYLQMLEEVSGEIVGVCTEILINAEQVLGPLSERSFIVIVDHISFAIEKMKKGIIIENPFNIEIKQLYPEEYMIGEYARRRIIEECHLDITEDEVGFIALHLNAAKEHKVVKEALKNTRMIKEMMHLVEKELEMSLVDSPRLYNRLLLHLRGFLQRIEEDDVGIKHPLYDETIKVCPRAHQLALKLIYYINKEKQLHLLETETFYLTLHMDRLIRKSQSH
jgi:transcriptional antiterminator